jgi:hypothetical protein
MESSSILTLFSSLLLSHTFSDIRHFADIALMMHSSRPCHPQTNTSSESFNKRRITTELLPVDAAMSLWQSVKWELHCQAPSNATAAKGTLRMSCHI